MFLRFADVLLQTHARISALIEIPLGDFTAVVFENVTSEKFDADEMAFIVLHPFAHLYAKPISENVSHLLELMKGMLLQAFLSVFGHWHMFGQLLCAL